MMKSHWEDFVKASLTWGGVFLDEALVLRLESSSFICCTPWLQAVPSEMFFLFH